MASCCTSVSSVAVSAVLASASACAKADLAGGIAASIGHGLPGVNRRVVIVAGIMIVIGTLIAAVAVIVVGTVIVAGTMIVTGRITMAWELSA